MHHIHVYFTAEEKRKALDVKEKIEQSYPSLRVGHIHDTPVGPHPVGSYEVDVPDSNFEDVRQFLEENSNGLTMLVHPATGDDLEDHTPENISWIGKPMTLNMKFFDYLSGKGR